MIKRSLSGVLMALLALSMSMLVFNVAVKQAKATQPQDVWEIPVLYIQPIDLGCGKVRVNVAIYNLTSTFYPTDEEWDPGEPLGPYASGPVARYNYSLGNMYAFDITISWNTAVLQYVSHEKTVPRGTTPQPWRSKGILNTPVLLAADTVDPIAGTCRIGYTSQYPAAPFNAPGDAANMFTVTFNLLGGTNYGLDFDSVSLVVDNVRFPGAQPNIPYRTVLAPPEAHNIGVEAAPRNKDVVGETKSFDTYTLIKNAGASTETANIKIYAGATIVGTASTTIDAGSQKTVKVTCSTTGLAKGTYTIRATVDSVTDETYTLDNDMIQGTIIVTLAGDVDGNKNVNIFDIVKMAGGYGTANQCATLFDPYSDLDNNYQINIFDIVTAAGNYGKSWT
jgi:hypothetical protein